MKYREWHDKTQAMFEKWIRCLGLGMWTIEILYTTDRDTVESWFPEIADGYLTLMTTDADWRYMTATIRVNVPAMRGRDDEELRNTIIHELCHVLVCEMHEGGMKHEERVVTMLQKAFVWTAGKDV